MEIFRSGYQNKRLAKCPLVINFLNGYRLLIITKGD
jgi:hypothetical protein